jgi:hypothetical protein
VKSVVTVVTTFVLFTPASRISDPLAKRMTAKKTKTIRLKLERSIMKRAKQKQTYLDDTPNITITTKDNVDGVGFRPQKPTEPAIVSLLSCRGLLFTAVYCCSPVHED